MLRQRDLGNSHVKAVTATGDIELDTTLLPKSFKDAGYAWKQFTTNATAMVTHFREDMRATIVALTKKLIDTTRKELAAKPLNATLVNIVYEETPGAIVELNKLPLCPEYALLFNTHSTIVMHYKICVVATDIYQANVEDPGIDSCEGVSFLV